MADPILVVEGLRKTFTPEASITDRLLRRVHAAVRPALLDVSLSLEAGEILGIVGESGSGKSTLARCLTLLTPPDAGRVVFDGVELTAVRGAALRTARRGIQVVFQDPYASLNPRLSVRDALAEVLEVHRLVPKDQVDRRVDELLAQVGLSTSMRSRYPADFSGGQRQRVCIARALAAEPRVLIADEAVSALDVSIQAQILNLLLDLRERLGLAMIFISHNLHVVRHVAPRIGVMFGGRIVELLPATIALESAEHPYTQALLAALPRLGAGLPALQERAAAERSSALPALGCPYRERCARVLERCSVEDPVLLPTTVPGHAVACHAVSLDVAGGHGPDPTQRIRPRSMLIERRER